MLLLSTFFIIIVFVCDFVKSQGQVSPITLSQSPFQTLNSSVSASTIGHMNNYIEWGITWKINGVGIGAIASNLKNVTEISVSTAYTDRISIIGFFPNSSNPLVMNSTLTLFNLQTSDNNITVQAGIDPPITVTLNVLDCSSLISHDVIVHADRYDYGAKGVFGCSNSGELFSSSGTKIQSNSTKCLAHATWKGQEKVQCWSAPVVQLMPANITGAESDTVKISCRETSLVYPTVHFMEVVVDGEAHAVLSNSNGSLTLKRSWNGKTATCKATSNYTIKTNQPAKSQPVNITVYYDPYSNEQPTVCTLYVSGPSSPCKVKFFSNPPITTYNFTKDGLPVTTDTHDLVQHGSNGLQTFIFSKSQVSNSDAGLYTLSVESRLNPGNLHKRLLLNFTVVIKQAQPTTNIALIAGSSAAGVVLVILVTVLVVVLNRRKHNKREGNPGQNSAPSPVSYYNTRGNETEQERGNQDTQNPQAAQEVFGNIHHYEAIRSNNRDDNRPTISQQVPSPSYESAHQYERPIRANEQDDNRPAISQKVPSPSYESAHQYERPIRSNEQDDNRPTISQQVPSPSYESAHQYERPIRANEQDNRPAISQQAPSPSYESAHQYERPIRSNEQDVADGAYIDFNI